ncbi:MAG: hypothetical protein ACOYVK_00705 [Bacillota bacterium]
MKQIIEVGKLIQNVGDDSEMVDYEMGFIDGSFIDDAMELQYFVRDSLDNKELFVVDPKDFLLNDILPPEKGRMIGVFVENRLVAYRTLSFPDKGSEYNLGKEINLPEEELDKVSLLEATVVHPYFRGNRLQSRMLKHTIALIKALGYHHVLSTISPFNYPSLSTVMKEGLTIRDLKRREGVYGGKYRFLLAENLMKAHRNHYTDPTYIHHADLEKQLQLLQDGYIGYALKKDEEGFHVLYGKLTSYFEQ